MKKPRRGEWPGFYKRGKREEKIWILSQLLKQQNQEITNSIVKKLLSYEVKLLFSTKSKTPGKEVPKPGVSNQMHLYPLGGHIAERTPMDKKCKGHTKTIAY